MEKGGPSGKGIQMTLPPAGGGRLSRLPAALSCPREAERKAMPPLAGRRMPLPLTAIADGKKLPAETGKIALPRTSGMRFSSVAVSALSRGRLKPGRPLPETVPAQERKPVPFQSAATYVIIKVS
jgi:hypothetical protein